jgi:hypothetical protein
MRWHDQMRQHALRSRRLDRFSRLLERREPPCDPVRTQRAEEVQLTPARRFGAAVGQIDNETLVDALNGGVWLVDEAPQAFREPVIAPGLPAIAIHALLRERTVGGLLAAA